MRVSIFRKGYFNAAHRLYVPEWSDEENYNVFGKCCNPHYHGHNYEVEVKVTGEVDPLTGIVINLKELKDIIHEHVEERYDHKNLNEELQEFENTNPSVENLCHNIWQILRNIIDEKYDIKVRLYESARNFAEFPE